MAKRIEWTPRRLANLKAMIEEGLTYREIGRRMRTSGNAVRCAANYHGLAISSRRLGGPAWSREEYDTLEKMIGAGLTYREIAERLERPRDAVRHCAFRLGLTHPERQRKNLRHDWNEILPIVQDCSDLEKLSMSQIHDRLRALGRQVSIHALRYHLERYHGVLYRDIVENGMARQARMNRLRGARIRAAKRNQEAAA